VGGVYAPSPKPEKAWEEMDVQIVEVIETDDKVAALVRLTGRGDP
jgi:hypothetical protein